MAASGSTFMANSVFEAVAFLRTSQAAGALNTLPLELQALTSTVTTPSIYALGTVTTVVSFAVMALALGSAALLRRRSTRGR